MRGVRMLRNFLDGKIPPVCSDDPEQLRILLTKCKKNLRQVADPPDLFDQAGTCANVECRKDTSPVKSSFSADGAKESTGKQRTSKLISKDDAKDGVPPSLASSFEINLDVLCLPVLSTEKTKTQE